MLAERKGFEHGTIHRGMDNYVIQKRFKKTLENQFNWPQKHYFYNIYHSQTLKDLYMKYVISQIVMLFIP